MIAKINLQPQKKKTHRAKTKSGKRHIVNSLVVVLILMIVSVSAVYAFRLVLTKESDLLDDKISQQEEIVASYKDIEERKSLLTLKTSEIQTIYEGKFDYLQALENAHELFGYSIEIESISIDRAGNVDMTARKTGEITLSKQDAFTTNIRQLSLSITVPTSSELKETIDTLLSFEGEGLSSVIVKSTSLVEDNEYQVVFAITFASS